MWNQFLRDIQTKFSASEFILEVLHENGFDYAEVCAEHLKDTNSVYHFQQSVRKTPERYPHLRDYYTGDPAEFEFKHGHIFLFHYISNYAASLAYQPPPPDSIDDKYLPFDVHNLPKTTSQSGVGVTPIYPSDEELHSRLIHSVQNAISNLPDVLQPVAARIVEQTKLRRKNGKLFGLVECSLCKEEGKISLVRIVPRVNKTTGKFLQWQNHGFTRHLKLHTRGLPGNVLAQNDDCYNVKVEAPPECY